MLRHARQFRVSEDRNRIGLYPRRNQAVIGLRRGVDGLMDQQSRAIQRRDDPKRNDTGPTDGKGHRETRQNAPEKAKEDDDQADFDAI